MPNVPKLAGITIAGTLKKMKDSIPRKKAHIPIELKNRFCFLFVFATVPKVLIVFSTMPSLSFAAVSL